MYINPENRFFESKNNFFDIRSKKKFLWIEESFVDSKKNSLLLTNLFHCFKGINFELTKISLIQRNFFFNRKSKKCFFDLKKLFSQCNLSWIFNCLAIQNSILFNLIFQPCFFLWMSNWLIIFIQLTEVRRYFFPRLPIYRKKSNSRRIWYSTQNATVKNYVFV